MSAEKSKRRHQSVEALEGENQYLTTANLQAALGVASPATANSWADEYSRLSERPVRRNSREARVFEAQQIEEITEAYRLLTTQVVVTRTEAVNQVLARQSKSTANNRLTAGGSEHPSSVDDTSGGSSDEIVCQTDYHYIPPHLEPTVMLKPVHTTDVSRKPLTIKVRWENLKTRVGRTVIFQCLLHCFSFGHSPHWQSLTEVQRNVWIWRVGWFNNVSLFFATVALISIWIIKLVLWGLSYGVKVAAIPFEPAIWTAIVCAYVIPWVLFSLFPQN